MTLNLKKIWGFIGETGKDIFGNIKGDEFYIGGDWSPELCYFVSFGGIGSLVHEITRAFGYRDFVLFADIVDINCDQGYVIFYYLGGFLDWKQVPCCDFGDFPPDIRSPKEWLKWARVPLTAARLCYMSDLGGRFDSLKKESVVR